MQLTERRRKSKTNNAAKVALAFVAIPLLGATLSSVAFWNWVGQHV